MWTIQKLYLVKIFTWRYDYSMHVVFVCADYVTHFSSMWMISNNDKERIFVDVSAVTHDVYSLVQRPQKRHLSLTPLPFRWWKYD